MTPLLAAIASAVAAAQPAAVQPEPPPAAPPAAALASTTETETETETETGTVLRAGTPVRLRVLERLSSRHAVQGKKFPVEVSEKVLVDGLTVIPEGARGVGEVARVIEKGMFGKSGKLRIRALFVEVTGHRIMLDGETRDTGEPGTAAVVLAAPLIGVSAGFFSGTSAVIEPGTEFEGFVRHSLPLRPAD